MMVDDAHASGVFGANGRGTIDHFGMHGRVDIQVGTLSKAIGALGGYVAGSKALIDFLYHRARPFLFSTSHPPSVAAACMAALDVLEQEPEIIERLWENTRFFKAGLQALGFNTGLSESPITPVIAGDGALAMKLSDRLFAGRRVRAGHRVPDRRAGQGARPHHRHRHAHARGAAVRARRVRQGRPGARAHLVVTTTATVPSVALADFFDSYTKDLTAEDLQRLFTRDTREAYRFFTRGLDADALQRLPWHRRSSPRRGSSSSRSR